MADNELDLFSWQIGKQTLFGTAVPQTAKLMGISGGSLKPVVESSAMSEIRGVLTPAYNITLDKKAGSATLEGDLLYEDVPFWLDSIFGLATPAGVGPYVYTHVGPGAKPTPRIFTLAHGSGVGVQSLVGAIVNKFGFAFESNKRGTFKTEFIGQSVVDDTLDALADRTVLPIHSNDVTVSIDAWGGTFGATPLTVAKYNISADFDANRVLQPSVGSITPASWKQKKGEAKSNTLKIAAEVDTATKAYLDSILTATSVGGPLKLLVRVLASLDANHKFQMDYAGFLAEAPELYTDADGVAQFEFVFSPIYNTTLTTWVKFTTTNQVTTLP